MEVYEKVCDALFEIEEKLMEFLRGNSSGEELEDALARIEGEIREMVYNLEYENYTLKEKNKYLEEEIKRLENEIDRLIEEGQDV